MEQPQAIPASAASIQGHARHAWLYRLWFVIVGFGGGMAFVAHHDVENACKCLRFHLLARGMSPDDAIVLVSALHIEKIPSENTIPAGEVLIEEFNRADSTPASAGSVDGSLSANESQGGAVPGEQS